MEIKIVREIEENRDAWLRYLYKDSQLNIKYPIFVTLSYTLKYM